MYTVHMKTLLTLLTVLLIALPVFADEPKTCTPGVDDECMIICDRNMDNPHCVCVSPDGVICMYPPPPPDDEPPIGVIITPQDTTPLRTIRIPTFTGISGLRPR